MWALVHTDASLSDLERTFTRAKGFAIPYLAYELWNKSARAQMARPHHRPLSGRLARLDGTRNVRSVLTPKLRQERHQ